MTAAPPDQPLKPEQIGELRERLGAYQRGVAKENAESIVRDMVALLDALEATPTQPARDVEGEITEAMIEAGLAAEPDKCTGLDTTHQYQRRVVVAIFRAMVAAAPETRAGDGWIVGNGDGDAWRSWCDGVPIWVKDRSLATRYARREDAEEVHEGDDDAWSVAPYSLTPPNPDPADRALVERLRTQTYIPDGDFAHTPESVHDLVYNMRQERREAAARIEALSRPPEAEIAREAIEAIKTRLLKVGNFALPIAAQGMLAEIYADVAALTPSKDGSK